MRLRLGLILAAIVAALLSPVPEAALALSTFPSAPNSVTATAIAGGLRVGWSAPTDIATGITAYRVEYSTSGTSGTWTQSGSVSGSTYTYDILGLAQVATYIRVVASASGNFGTYGYPWTKMYGTTALNRNSSGAVDFETGFGVSAGDPSVTKAGSAFTRIKYRLDTTISGNTYFAETDFYGWNRSSTSVATARTQWDPSTYSIIIPTLNSPYTYLIQANVTDMNIYSTSPSVTNTAGVSGVNGRLEIWPYNYGTELSTLSDGSTTGNSATYDFNDTPDINNGGAYASFQVHDLANYKPVFVWDNTSYGATPEVAYGKNTGTHPDWTFCSGGGISGSCPVPSSFRIQIYINIPVTPLADVTPPTVSRIDGKSVIQSGDTITVSSTEVGNAYLIRNTVSVTNVASITAAASNVKNSVAISAANTNTTLTTSGLLDGTYNLYAVDLANNVSTGLLATVQLDSTPPVATAFAVNSNGNSISITINETVTARAFDSSAYMVSDSGSALSVTSASVSGLIITLNLSRSIPQGATVSFAYSTSGIATAARWSDAAGNQLTNVSSRTITNNSGVPISVSLTLADPISKGVSATITATVSVAGKVSFTIAGKRISGCLNKVATGSTPISVTCTFKPALTARQTISAVLIPTLGGYPTTVASVDRFILKRTTTR
jgi:hypothetical protein